LPEFIGTGSDRKISIIQVENVQIKEFRTPAEIDFNASGF